MSSFAVKFAKQFLTFVGFLIGLKWKCLFPIVHHQEMRKFTSFLQNRIPQTFKKIFLQQLAASYHNFANFLPTCFVQSFVVNFPQQVLRRAN